MKFWKVQASGNDFVMIDCRDKAKSSAFYARFAKQYCDRRFGVGADGILVAEKAGKHLKMRIFNADGSEAEMCGNGSRCFALWAVMQGIAKNPVRFMTRAGLIEARIGTVKNNSAPSAVRLSDPKGLKFDIPVDVNGRTIRVNFINTGVPHAVIFVEGVDTIDVASIGRAVRNHRQFLPAGTNVNFVEQVAPGKLHIRTYERGVEDETLSCGTGTCASAIISVLASGDEKSPCTVEVTSKSGELLTVTFSHDNAVVHDVWFEGKAFIVFEGCL
jgi:diaminopimelate epimerase